MKRNTREHGVGPAVSVIAWFLALATIPAFASPVPAAEPPIFKEVEVIKYVPGGIIRAQHDVFLGCSCPTKKNREPGHCHTYLGMQFMKAKYPGLEVRI